MVGTTTTASRTAVQVCQGRAIAHGRMAVGRFADPTAPALLRDDERARVERARATTPPADWSQRMDADLLTRQAESMAVRTVAVDDAIRSGAHPQLVIVGAGLDGRAWRMPELAAVEVVEVDHPASQADKRARVDAAGLRPTAGSLRFAAVDLASEPLGPALEAAGHAAGRPTTWVVEGVLPYLTPDDAAATVGAIAARSAPGSRLVVTYQLGTLAAVAGRTLARAIWRVSGPGDPMADEPRRSSWSQASVRALAAGTGLRVTGDVHLAALASDLDVPTRNLATSRVAVAIA